MKIILLALVLCFALAASAVAQNSLICIYQPAAGRITTESGAGVRSSVEIVATLGIDPTARRVLQTGSFGLFFTAGLISCENYEVRPLSSRFSFAPETRLVVPAEGSFDINFTAFEKDGAR